MNPADPIIACATGFGRCSRALLRLSAPDLAPVLAAHLASPLPAARGISRADLRLTDTTTLPTLLLWYPAPHSATAQDVAELLIPGNPALIHRIVERFHASDPPMRTALPGEFTARAFLAGRMTAEQAEGVQALIGAQTSAELDAAHALLSGDTGNTYRALADDLASALALVEAGIDFTDQEDVVPIAAADLALRLDALIAALADALRGSSADSSRDRPVRIVLAGPPNAGKSTLFNRILGRDRAIASAEPGTTRDAIVEPITARDLADSPSAIWHDLALELVDLAGLDASLAPRSPADAAAQAAAHRELAAADVIVWCDPAGTFDTIPHLAPDATILRIRTKADLPGSASLRLASPPSPSPPLPTAHCPLSPPPTAHCPLPPLSICAIDGWNLGALGRAIVDAAAAATRAHTSHTAALLPRHHSALAGALDAIAAARAETRPETTAAHLRAALDHLGSICGRIDPDDIIGRIFATFCVGK